MNNYYKQIFALTGIFMIGLTGCSTESSSNAVLDGLYEQPMGELEHSEPVATYLAIRDHLAAGNMEEAAKLTDDPAKFIEKRKKHFGKVDHKKVAAGLARTRELLKVHSVHHDGDIRLLWFWTLENTRQQLFSLAMVTTFIEAVDPSGFSKTLTRQFYIAKGEPDVELAGD